MREKEREGQGDRDVKIDREMIQRAGRWIEEAQKRVRKRWRWRER